MSGLRQNVLYHNKKHLRLKFEQAYTPRDPDFQESVASPDMVDVLIHGTPVVLAMMSFWCNTERKLLCLNLALCIAMASLMLFEQAWGGMLVMLVAGLCTSYRLITQRLLNAKGTGLVIVLMSACVGLINRYSSSHGWLEVLPLMTFIFYRFGELYCQERELRLCMFTGSALFTVYGVATEAWGVALTECLFAASNGWYWLKLRRADTARI